MGVAILQPQNCLRDSIPTNNLSPHMKCPRNPNASKKKPLSNRPRRSPPRSTAARSTTLPSPPPRPRSSSPTVEKNLNRKIDGGQVRILKRGEGIPKETSDLVVEKSDLVSTRSIAPVKEAIYAGTVTMTSPPPSDLPLPGFFTRSVSMFTTDDATSDLIKMLRLDIA